MGFSTIFRLSLGFIELYATSPAEKALSQRPPQCRVVSGLEPLLGLSMSNLRQDLAGCLDAFRSSGRIITGRSSFVRGVAHSHEFVTITRRLSGRQAADLFTRVFTGVELLDYHEAENGVMMSQSRSDRSFQRSTPRCPTFPCWVFHTARTAPALPARSPSLSFKRPHDISAEAPRDPQRINCEIMPVRIHILFWPKLTPDRPCNRQP